MSSSWVAIIDIDEIRSIALQQATKENDQAIVNASFHVTHWIIAPYGTGLSRVKNMTYVFGGEVVRFLHGGDECLTVPPNFSLDNPETK